MTLLTRIQFEEPPARTNRPLKKTKHEIIADKLRKRTGEWARIGSYVAPSSSNSIAHQIRKGRISAYAPTGSFEAVSRTVEGKHIVWARYIGGGESA